MTTRHVCPLCGSDRSVAYTSGPELLTDLGVADEQGLRSAILVCGTCEFVHSEPLSLDSLQVLYNHLSEGDEYYAPDRPEFEFFGAHVSPGTRVLDWGCGSGNFSGTVSKAGGTYTGVDFAGPAIAAGRELGRNLLTTEEFASVEGTFDVVVLNQVLEHLSDPIASLSALLGRVSEHGKIAVAVPNPASSVMWATGVPLEFPPHHLTRWHESHLRSIGQRLGLQVVAYEAHSLSHEHAGLWVEGSLRRAMRRNNMVYRRRGFLQRVAVRGSKRASLRTLGRCAGLYHSMVFQRP